MIDIGVNLLNGQFSADREAVVARAWDAGIEHMILTGTDVDSSRAAADYAAAEGSGRLTATAGIHPHHAAEPVPEWQQAIAALIRRPEVVALGETGLDFHRNFAPRAAQEALFREQLALANRLRVPVFVHDREAGETVAGCLRESGVPGHGVVVHCFTGSAEDLYRYLDLGCFIGITGWVCDRRRGDGLRALVPGIPIDRLMVETDAPFLRPHDAPSDEHGRRNEPALLTWVIRRLAKLYDMAPDALAARTATNARTFFRLDTGSRASSQ